MNYIILVLLVSVLGLVFAFFQAKSVLDADEGDEKVKSIAAKIRKGANAYLKRQYKGVAIFFVIMFLVFLCMSLFGYLSIFVPFSFVIGGFLSGLSGYIGMKVATYANGRTTTAAKKSLNDALKISFKSGSVIGIVVVSLGLLYIGLGYLFLDLYYANLPEADKILNITTNILTFGIGASSMALFARVGGGIFTKAADVGADLVGKVEVGIPEDDPRNPAVIADNVGDNVGDVAGMGADLYESYIGSIVSSCALAVAAGLSTNGVMLPLLVAALGIVASIFASFFVKAKEDATQKNLLKALRRGTYISSVIVAVGAFFIVNALVGKDNIGIYFSILSGLIAGMLIGFFTEYYTSDNYKPTKNLAEMSKTGPATVIIGGLSLGMVSTAIPVIIVSISVLISFYLSGG